MPDYSRTLSIKSISESERTIDVVASTDSIDSYGEIVEQDWDLARFKRNPVVLFAHDSRELPIGTAIDVSVVAGKLSARIKFASGTANPQAERAWLLVKEGVLRGVSVGFQSHDKRWEKRASKEVQVLRKNELYEISLVPVPANADTVARSKALSRPVKETRGTPEVRRPSKLLDAAAKAGREAAWGADPDEAEPRGLLARAHAAAKKAGGSY